MTTSCHSWQKVVDKNLCPHRFSAPEQGSRMIGQSPNHTSLITVNLMEQRRTKMPFQAALTDANQGVELNTGRVSGFKGD
ncbi:hypothetical protein Pan110_22570 [Gimesia panareensis]|nr:hypothetical protein Pan110_22570 [Gimesia panareensis]